MKQFIKSAREWFANEPERRDHIYAIAQAALALAVVYGLLTAAYANAWLALIIAVLQVSRKNVY